MLSVCVRSWINCCQGLYIQSRLFQVLYIQSPPAFQKLFCLDRFASEDKTLKRTKKTDLIGFLKSDLIDISDYINRNEEKKKIQPDRFRSVVQTRGIEKREKERVLKKTRDSTEWAVSVFKAWAQYQNNEILTLNEEYPNVPVNLETTGRREINY